MPRNAVKILHRGSRRVLAGITSVVATSLMGHAVAADDGSDYPKKPVRMLVPLGAGGGVDVLARLIAQKLGEAWGQQVVVDNRPGAAGTVGTSIAAKAPADGYTLLLTTNAPLTTHLALYKKLDYGVEDFAPVRMIVYAPVVVIVRGASGPKSISELVAQSKQVAGGYSVATTGNGSIGHFLLAHLIRSQGASLTHVPYKGGVPGAAAVVSGEAQLGILDTGAVMAFIRDNRVRALGIVGEKRSPVLPEVPTLTELGVTGGEIIAWAAVVAPKGTPKSIVDKTSDGIARALRDPQLRDKVLSAGMAPVDDSTPETFAAFLRQEVQRWRQRVDDAGLKPE